jgi:RimJ/RimL family protein N-acetyltransferase
MGFKHEGTMKDATIYNDKNGKPKFYDALIYSLTREDIK